MKLAEGGSPKGESTKITTELGKLNKLFGFQMDSNKQKNNEPFQNAQLFASASQKIKK